jgi:hypothetical protein
VSHDAFDGGARLLFVEHDRLVIHDPVAVEHMGVDAGCVGAPPGIDARVPQVL